MGGEIFKNAPRKLKVSSIPKFQNNISLESRENSLSNDINIIENKTILVHENMSQIPKQRKINNLTNNSAILSGRISIDKKLAVVVVQQVIDKINDMSIGKIASRVNPIFSKRWDLFNFEMKAQKNLQRKDTQTGNKQQQNLYRKDTQVDLDINQNSRHKKKFITMIKLGIEGSIMDETCKQEHDRIDKIFTQKVFILVHDINHKEINRSLKFYLIFDPGIILILYNLFIIANMNAHFRNLNLALNYNGNTVLITSENCLQWLAYFDEQYFENYWHTSSEDERFHIVDSIANDYFNIFQHYNFRDAIITFYINFNLDRIYYFEHTCINVEPYNLPNNANTRTVLKIRFDVIINDPVDLNRLFIQ